jgi:hypothetical protein
MNMSISFMAKIKEANEADRLIAKGEKVREGLLPENDDKAKDSKDKKDPDELDNDPDSKDECGDDGKWESLFHTRLHESEDGKKGETDDSTVGSGSESPADDKTNLPGGTADASKNTTSGNPDDPNNDSEATKAPENPMADLKESLILKHFDEAITDAAKIKVGQIYVIDGQEYAFITMKANGKIAAKVMRMSDMSLEKLASSPMSEFAKAAEEIVLPEAEFMAYNISGRVDLKNKSIVAEAKMKKFFEALDPQASLANLAMEYPDDPNNEPAEPEMEPSNEDAPLAGSVLKAMAGAEKGNTANAGKDGTDQAASSTTQEDPQTATKTTESKDKDDLGDWWSKLSEEDKETAKKFLDAKKKECDSKK